jgi:hypothetical protein
MTSVTGTALPSPRRVPTALADVPATAETAAELRRVRRWLAVFVVGLVLSGVTAFPLETETRWLSEWLRHGGAGGGRWLGSWFPGLPTWIDRVHAGLADTNRRYPFIAYGTDWLAFGHLTIAAAFYGPLRDPVRNKWVVHFGLVACAGVIPLALLCGPVRGIPFGWSLIDMSFGVFGALPLVPVLRGIRALENASPTPRAVPEASPAGG